MSGGSRRSVSRRPSILDRPERGSQAPMKFPMFVVAVPDLLALPRLLPHQTMLEQGLLREYTDEMAGRVLFLSHQWLGWELRRPVINRKGDTFPFPTPHPQGGVPF